MDGSSLISRRHQVVPTKDDPFAVDVRRILHSKAYARYADKTQVVYLLPHDHIASRGLHVQLVSFLARSIGRKLGLNESLIEAISLGHDIGHAPFGHEGEEYLSDLSVEAGLGCFSHSRQSCRVSSIIEPMNLTLAVLDGFLCHDGGMSCPTVEVVVNKGWERHDRELERRKDNAEDDVAPATCEAAVVKLADTASYLERDLNDALTLGIVTCDEVPSGLLCDKDRSICEMVEDDIVSTYRTTHTVGYSDEMFAALRALRKFNFERIYLNKSLKTESNKIRMVYQLLFHHVVRDWKLRGRESLLWRHFLHNKASSYVEGESSEQLAVDYIAGMTDGYFLRLFEELFLPQSITLPNVLPFS
jgi:dGTPase